MKTFFKKFSLLATIFLTGACVLIVEVVAIRILSPYFGNTLYAVSSILGVILAALSTGYYLGGKIADKNPSEFWFYSIIGLGGASIIIIEIINISLLPFFAYRLSLVWGPLAVSMLLFFLPALLLGMLSPYAICLEKIKNPNVGTGTVSGKIFFWSTLGSIAGSLLSGFYLIPRFGVSRILAGTGLVLILVGLAALKIKPLKKILLGIFFVFLISSLLSKEKILTAKTLYAKDGVYEKIIIFDSLYELQRARFLMQDRSNSGAMFLKSDTLVFPYTKYFILYKAIKSDIINVLAIGGGAYSVPKAYLLEDRDAQVDISEIEPGLYSLAKQYFQLEENPRLANFTQDGRRFLVDAKKEYDVIFSDVYFSLYSVPTHFTTQEFFKLAKSRLAENGVLIANIIGGLSAQKPSFLFSEIKTFQSVFENSYFFAVDSPDTSRLQNIIFLGINGNAAPNWEKVKDSENEILKNLPQHLIDVKKFDLSSEILLTDDFAPVEFLISKMLK